MVRFSLGEPPLVVCGVRDVENGWKAVSTQLESEINIKLTEHFLLSASQDPTGLQQLLHHPKVQKFSKKRMTICFICRHSTRRPFRKSPTCWPRLFAKRSSVTCWPAPRCCCRASFSRESPAKCCLAAKLRPAASAAAISSSSSKTKWDTRDKSHRLRLIPTRWKPSNYF